jgi:hypothetical protein
MYRDLVYRPGSDSIAVETLPYNPSSDDSKIEALGQAFLNAFIGGPGPDVAGYVPFVPVAPGDIDPGGPESLATEAAMAEYLRGRRERGDFDRARQRLMQRGFPLGGV